ncbi:hypothetical protein ABS735_02985 [Streptomyces sp. MMCC 100]|uniref:hypothetical protein n=1 Tax=Streptomyces sp. MMCC 100 TaxID=3163555 RepID=UPI003599C89D
MTSVAVPRRSEAWNGPVGTHRTTHRVRYDALFGAAAVAPGDRVLDVGRGAGATARTAARLAVPGRTVDLLLSRYPGRPLPAGRLAGPEAALLPQDAGTGVRMRAGVWRVTAVRS